MIKQQVQVEGLAELEAALAGLGPEATRAGRLALRRTARQLAEALRAAAPKGTRPTVRRRKTRRGVVTADFGRLRDNIRVREERALADNTVVFRVDTRNAFWGAFLEFGTRRMRARPWFRPVWLSFGPSIPGILSAELARAIQIYARRRAKTRGGR